MGQKKKEVKRVVLDTNVLVSALLFKGELSKIVVLWKTGRITPLISKETFEELNDVLHYPKFKLTEDEIKTIIEDEILPFFEVVKVNSDLKGGCRDSDDDKFIECAVAAKADAIVSGDKDLCDLKEYKTIPIVTGTNLLKLFYSFK